eukprot:6459183-Amphidinium_carterae.1
MVRKCTKLYKKWTKNCKIDRAYRFRGFWDPDHLAALHDQEHLLKTFKLRRHPLLHFINWAGGNIPHENPKALVEL